MKNISISNLLSAEEVKKLFSLFYEKFHCKSEFLIRIPARVNLLGTHVDHRGGWLNYIAINRYFWIIGSSRNDSKVSLINLDPIYPPEEFDIKNETPCRYTDWETGISGLKIKHSWANYIKCAFVYLQHRFPEMKIMGCNLACWGNVPQGAGLSSSSTLVTGAMLAARRVNKIKFSDSELVSACGRAEWYVGTRGGCGDHAAMVLCKKDKICHMQFYPFRIQYLPFFENSRVIVINSMIEAKKSAGAKETFNQRVACYEIGFKMLKEKFPKILEKCEYLRDLNPETLGNSEIVYDLLLSLPEVVTKNQIRNMLPDFYDKMDQIFQIQSYQGDFRIRDVVSYGIFECERSRVCIEHLLKNNAPEFGRLMYTSHDGDRIVRYINGVETPWTWHADDNTLLMLKKKIKENVQEAHLHYQPGNYGCSKKELDFIVDCIKKIPSVYGAKLTGAGLGGCVVALCEASGVEKVVEALNENYYKPRMLPSQIIISEPEDGSIIVETENV